MSDAIIKLKPHKKSSSGSSCVLSNEDLGLSLSIPKNRESWVELLDGTRNFEAFLHDLAEQKLNLDLKELITFMQLLQKSGFVQQGLEHFSPPDEDEESAPEIASHNPDEKDIFRFIDQLPFFQGFTPEFKAYVSKNSFVKKADPGTCLVKQGDPSSSLFALLSGSASVYVKRKQGGRIRVCVLHSGTVFGETALKEEGIRQADVYAKNSVIVLIVPAEVFHKALDKYADVETRVKLDEKILLSQYLSTSPIFSHLPLESLPIVQEHGKLIRKGANETVFAQGEKGSSFYMIVRGQALVSKTEGKPVMLKQGDCFGEIALFKGVPRTATVKAAEETVLLQIEATDFWTLLSRNLGMALMLEDVAEKRLKGGSLTLT